MKTRHDIVFGDLIAEPGPITALSKNKDIGTLKSVTRKMGSSINVHGSRIVDVAGLSEYVGNPISEERRKGNNLRFRTQFY